jgi:hypothetical protein
MKGIFMRYLYVKYQNPIHNGSKDIAQVKVFSKLGQSSRSQGQKSWYQKKDLFIGYPHVKYENPVPYDSKDMAQVKVFQNHVKVQDLGQKSQKI